MTLAECGWSALGATTEDSGRVIASDPGSKLGAGASEGAPIPAPDARLAEREDDQPCPRNAAESQHVFVSCKLPAGHEGRCVAEREDDHA